jgi:hypothetical protein
VLELTIEARSFKSVRVLRILRPMKTINALPGMKKLIAALISSIPEFANVVIFLVFVFLMFATIGLYQYNGAFYNACRITDAPREGENFWEADFTDGRLCSTSGSGNYLCPQGTVCGNPDQFASQLDL